VGTAWTTAPARLELLGASSIVGRSGVCVRITPLSGTRRVAGVFSSGDEHEIVVDDAFGLTLSVTSFVDGTAFPYNEVVDLEVNAEIPPEITAPPAHAEVVPPTQGHRSPRDVADAAELSVFAPAWLPPDYTFQTGAARVDKDGIASVDLTFSKDRREFIQLWEYPDSPLPAELDAWEQVVRGDRRTVISDVSDATGTRIAITSLDGTCVTIYAALPAVELLDVAFSLERVS
jgi:hypothetical protein